MPLAPLASKMSHGHLHAMPDPLPGSPMSMRVLIVFEDLRYLYRELLVKALLDWRPTLHVRSASLQELADVLLEFEPHVVVCSEPNGAHPAGSGAWVQIPTGESSEDSARLAQLCLDGEHWLTEGLPLSELFAIIDETKERLEEGRLSEDC
jgi:hypothetical protein